MKPIALLFANLKITIKQKAPGAILDTRILWTLDFVFICFRRVSLKYVLSLQL